MGREIKFRAWDEEARTMLYEGWTGKPQFFVNMGVWQFTDKENLSVLHIMDKKPNLLPMQYTGLKDKNGVDIYEGDILQFKSDLASKLDIRGVMEWDESRNGWSQFEPLHLYKVIGNIYENTELLNKRIEEK